jgi:hypothetical protein
MIPDGNLIINIKVGIFPIMSLNTYSSYHIKYRMRAYDYRVSTLLSEVVQY